MRSTLEDRPRRSAERRVLRHLRQAFRQRGPRLRRLAPDSGLRSHPRRIIQAARLEEVHVGRRLSVSDEGRSALAAEPSVDGQPAGACVNVGGECLAAELERTLRQRHHHGVGAAGGALTMRALADHRHQGLGARSVAHCAAQTTAFDLCHGHLRGSRPTSELLQEVTRNGGNVIVLDDGKPHLKLP